MISKAKLKALSLYKTQKQCEADNLFVVEGSKMCEEALRSDLEIVCLCAQAEWLQPRVGLLASRSDIEMLEVSEADLERLSSLRSTGKAWMLVRRPTHTLPPTDSDTPLLALDGLQDPGNMGTIVRTADWFGMRQIVCNHNTVSCYNAKAVQASMGSLFRTEVCYTALPEWLSTMRQQGYAVCGATLGGTSIYDVPPPTRAIIVVGNEGHGLSEAVDGQLTHRITIPNVGSTCESLNASIATAIILADLARRLHHTSPSH